MSVKTDAQIVALEGRIEDLEDRVMNLERLLDQIAKAAGNIGMPAPAKPRGKVEDYRIKVLDDSTRWKKNEPKTEKKDK